MTAQVIRCEDREALARAKVELEAHALLSSSTYIVQLHSHTILASPTSSTRTIYLSLPFLSGGSANDRLEANGFGPGAFSETEVVQIARNVARGLEEMHTLRRTGSKRRTATKKGTKSSKVDKGKGKMTYPPSSTHMLLNSHDDDSSSPAPFTDNDVDDSDGEADALISAGGQVPRSENAFALLSDEDDELDQLDGDDDDGAANDTRATPGVVEPWAHRDVKPGNIMFSSRSSCSSAVLMDLGSASPARQHISTRAQALVAQDLAAEQCSMAYRAPELFDVKTGADLDEKVDVWSFGASVYALMYGHSPFESAQQSQLGGSVAMAVLSGKYDLPPRACDGVDFSDGLQDVVRNCLVVDPAKRPSIQEIRVQVDTLANHLDVGQ